VFEKFDFRWSNRKLFYFNFFSLRKGKIMFIKNLFEVWDVLVVVFLGIFLAVLGNSAGKSRVKIGGGGYSR
jgi:hypothetical protein